MITHHCSECGNQVEEFCAEHPKAMVESVLSSTSASDNTAASLRVLPDALFAAAEALRKEIADPNMNPVLLAAELRAMACALNLCADGLETKSDS